MVFLIGEGMNNYYNIELIYSMCSGPPPIRPLLGEGKPPRMRRLCLKTSEAEGRGGLGITSSSEEVYELTLIIIWCKMLVTSD